MFKQRLKLLATVTPEKPSRKKPFVQVEGKLTPRELEAIAGGAGDDGCPITECTNHNETMFVLGQLNLEGGTYV